MYNNKNTIFFRLKSKSIKEWNSYINHNFVKKLSDGSLSDKSFKNYLLQDYIFLQRFMKILSVAAFRSKTIDDMHRSIDFIIGIKHEIKLHINYCKRFNLSRNKVLRTKEKKANQNYTNYVMTIGLNKSLLELFIALSPCIIGYGEIGYNLSRKKNWKKSKYSSWIKMYASKEYQSLAKSNIRYLDQLNKREKIEFNTMLKVFKKASVLESEFWQMSL